MQSILNKCQIEDLKYISNTLDSYVSFTNDRKRKSLLEAAEKTATLSPELIALLDKQIRYFGSSDLAYGFRRLFNDDGAIPAHELIDDVCSKCKVNVKKGGSVEFKLERLVIQVVEKELLSKKPADLAKEFEKIGMGKADIAQVEDALKSNGKIAILPIIVELLGPKIALGLIETIIINMIAQFIGKEAAKQLLKEVVKRNPWVNALGPIIWTISGAWIALDLQGPAYRKTVPVLLYLGVVALRDGKEKK